MDLFRFMFTTCIRMPRPQTDLADAAHRGCGLVVVPQAHANAPVVPTTGDAAARAAFRAAGVRDSAFKKKSKTPPATVALPTGTVLVRIFTLSNGALERGVHPLYVRLADLKDEEKMNRIFRARFGRTFEDICFYSPGEGGWLEMLSLRGIGDAVDHGCNLAINLDARFF